MNKINQYGEKMITSISNKKIKDLKKLKENKNIRKYKRDY